MSIPSAYQTTDDMASAVQRNTALPNSQQTYQAADIIAMLDEEQKVTITNLVQSVREDYWLNYSDTVIVANVTEYTLPERSVAGTVEDIVLLDTAGNEHELGHLDMTQVKTGPLYTYIPNLTLRGLFFKDDKIESWPTSLQLPVGWSIRVKYLRRPSTLTATANCAQITAINTGTKTVTCSSVPTDWPTSGGTVIDIINNKPQFTAIQDGLTITSISGFDVVLPSLPSSLAVGQWLCPTGTTCQPQIPVEAYPLLTNLGVLRVYMAMQNANGFQTTAKIVESMQQDVLQMLTPRWKGETKKVINRNAAWRWNGGPYNGGGWF